MITNCTVDRGTMRGVRRFRFGPLLRFTLLSLAGFLFFTISFILLEIYPETVNGILIEKYKFEKGLSELRIFIVLSFVSGFGFLITFVQLLIVKPTSKKIIIPIVVVTTIAFAIMVAIDFSLELQLARHVALNPPKVIDNGKPKKKGRGNSGFKTGYMIIYVSMCLVAGYIYLAFKDLEEYLEDQKNENEPNEIVISHIT